MTDFSHLEDMKDSIKKGNTIAVLWSIEDIILMAEKRDEKLTEEEARKVLGNIERQHDACVGINWDVIDCHLDF